MPLISHCFLSLVADELADAYIVQRLQSAIELSSDPTVQQWCDYLTLCAAVVPPPSHMARQRAAAQHAEATHAAGHECSTYRAAQAQKQQRHLLREWLRDDRQ